MVRITKEAAERKNELMDTALELFLEQGFETTTIRDVVKKVGVAQGLFYYYFKSKDEMLDAVVDRYVDSSMTSLENCLADKKLNIEKKLHIFLNNFFGFDYKDKRFADYLHQEKNAILHQKFTDLTITRVTPLLSQIIKEGISKKLFNTPYPEETLEILIPGMMVYLHRYYYCQNRGIIETKRAAMENIIEKMLGAEKGSLPINLPTTTQI